MMLYTRTAIDPRDGVAALAPAIVGGDWIVEDAGGQSTRVAIERALDEVLADSFPASDPPSWNTGIIRPQPAGSFASGSVPGQHAEKSVRMGDVIDVSRPADGDRTFLHTVVSVVGAAGLALLAGIGILLAGLPIVLVVRGLVEAAGWLFGIDVR